jgi:serine/threonine protein phosphatase 1
MFGKKTVLSGAKFAEGRLGFAIGDIHGRADLLAKMLDRLEADAAGNNALQPVAIFLGDYIDRGLESARVVDLLLNRPERAKGMERVFLRGNHEQALQQFLDEPLAARGWLIHGGVETLISYGVRPVSPTASDDALKETSLALARAIPIEHMSFFASLRASTEFGDYFFAHAGVDPERSLAEQREHDLYWIRDRFLQSTKPWEKVVVHGHTPAKEGYRDHRRIGVDTGAYATGRLTAARLEGSEVSFITV